ncbi:MAG: prolyl oligopeptidase family serine peptidase [Chloroflexi bacterium]|nr:prolyl oligopeptidase family serine peptidase [Chloroflexota bacterium]
MIARRPAWLWPLVSVALLVGLAWLAITDDARVWPVRNTAEYHVLRWWWDRFGEPLRGEPGALRGIVRDAQGRSLAGAHVLVARWDGTSYSAVTAVDGSYRIGGVPAGSYVPVAGASGHAGVALGRWWPPWLRVEIAAGKDTVVDAVLPVAAPPVAGSSATTGVSAATTLRCESPLASEATRRTITFEHGRGRWQQAWYYVPIDTGASSAARADASGAPPTSSGAYFPVLLTVYPGPADQWECVSVPLAAAGYAVLAVGPDYSFALERDVDDLQGLVAYVRAGGLGYLGADGSRIGVLAGSYSSLHVQRLLQRDREYAAALLLGPIADLFDMRRRLEDRTFLPPFGLDQALVALGLPDRQPLRYWRYSSVYHVRRDLPPTDVIHSRSDDVVPFQQGERLARALAAVGAPYELHILEGAGHYLLSERDDALRIYRLTLAFLEKHLSSPLIPQPLLPPGEKGSKQLPDDRSPSPTRGEGTRG